MTADVIAQWLQAVAVLVLLGSHILRAGRWSRSVERSGDPDPHATRRELEALSQHFLSLDQLDKRFVSHVLFNEKMLVRDATRSRLGSDVTRLSRDVEELQRRVTDLEREQRR